MSGEGPSSNILQEQMRILSSQVTQLQNRVVQYSFGTIVGIRREGSQAFYEVQVRPDRDQVSPARFKYIPLIDETEVIAASYGSPEDLIGRRVRIEYRGAHWSQGTAKLVRETNRRTDVSANLETSTQPFTFAPPGSGM